MTDRSLTATRDLHPPEVRDKVRATAEEYAALSGWHVDDVERALWTLAAAYADGTLHLPAEEPTDG